MLFNFIKFLLGAAMSAFVVALIVVVGTISYYSHDLPDYRQLADYNPPILSRLYTADGLLLKEYARQKRIFVPVTIIPEVVIDAFISAEDRNFYSHFGIDIIGIARALWNNVVKHQPLQGGSTITQQVAKNMMLSSERTMERKIKEAILATRMSFTFSKERVLELYLNETYLGAGSYGVAAAALNYFNKSIDELNIQEAALLASMPKAPTAYNPWRNYDRALERRNWVINAMHEEGYISKAAAEYAKKQPIGLRKRGKTIVAEADFFAEEVRRFLVKKFGEEKLYEGGLVVHTNINPSMQNMAEKAFRNGLVSYSRRHGYKGPLTKTDVSENWQQHLNKIPVPAGAGDWQLAAVLNVFEFDKIAEIGFKNGDTSYITFEALRWAKKERHGGWKKLADILQQGDVILVEKLKNNISPYALRQIPDVNGAMVAMDPYTGHVLAMVGGFTFERDSFNRAIQAKRQPGSAFKPFVYLTALEQNYTPASLIADEPIEFKTGANNIEEEETAESWAPQNYTGNFYGPTTLRRGVEKSINVMTVHLGLKVGIDNIIDTAEKFGISKNPPRNMSAVLGAGETDLLSLTTAFGMIVNGGKKIAPSLIDRVQDNGGKTIYKNDDRTCRACKLTSLTEPVILPEASDNNERVVDERSAFQMVSILEGVVQRGTAKQAGAIGKPVAGKTGTTNNSVDSWFVGFSPDLVVGVYVGFDKPKSLGKKEEGSTVALPIFVEFMREALKAKPTIPFRIPSGIKMVKIDANTGFLPSEETKSEDIILEAFKSGTEPTRTAKRDENLPVINPPKALNNEEQSDELFIDIPVTRGIGGIY